MLKKQAVSSLITHHHLIQYQEVEPKKMVRLWLVQAYNDWEDGEAEQDSARNVLPVNWTMTTSGTKWKMFIEI